VLKGARGGIDMGKMIVLTGAKGSGKSTALATIAPPRESNKVFVVDTEMGMSDIVNQVDFGYYLRAHERFDMGDRMLTRIAKGDLPWVSKGQKNSLVEYYHWFVNEMDIKLEDGKYKYLIIDTIEPIEAAMTAAVDDGVKKFGWGGSRAYGRMETEGVRPLYENMIESFYQRGVEVVGISTHIKPVWMDDKPIMNKVKPGGRIAVLSRLSSLMLWLVQDDTNEDGAPAALVLKARLGKMVADNGGWKVQRVLPKRIPRFTWSEIDRYMEYPANMADPASGELPSSSEIDMISEFLTDEQMKLMVIGAEMERDLARQGKGVLNNGIESLLGDVSDEIQGEVGILFASGVPAPLIAKRIGLSLPQVRAILTKMESSEDVEFEGPNHAEGSEDSD